MYTSCIPAGMKLLALAPLAVALTAGLARADEAPVDKRAVAADLRSYYGGEARSAYAIMALSVASVGSGTFLVTRDSDFSRGLGWPLLTLGAVEGLGAIFYAFQVGAETRRYETALARDGAAFQRDELLHMRGTTTRFVFYRLTELALTLGGAGIATYGFATDRDVWKGAGIGVTAVALPFLIIDTVNNARAARYEDSVRRFDPAGEAPRKVDAAWTPSTPWMASYAGTF